MGLGLVSGGFKAGVGVVSWLVWGGFRARVCLEPV